jgi:hypothetical protein
MKTKDKRKWRRRNIKISFVVRNLELYNKKKILNGGL